MKYTVKVRSDQDTRSYTTEAASHTQAVAKERHRHTNDLSLAVARQATWDTGMDGTDIANFEVVDQHTDRHLYTVTVIRTAKVADIKQMDREEIATYVNELRSASLSLANDQGQPEDQDDTQEQPSEAATRIKQGIEADRQDVALFLRRSLASDSVLYPNIQEFSWVTRIAKGDPIFNPGFLVSYASTMGNFHGNESETWYSFNEMWSLYEGLHRLLQVDERRGTSAKKPSGIDAGWLAELHQTMLSAPYREAEAMVLRAIADLDEEKMAEEDSRADDDE